MEGITLFVSIVIIVFGILQIILFFKLWGMTNDVKKIRKSLPNVSSDLSPAKMEFIIGNTDKAKEMLKKEFVLDVYESYMKIVKENIILTLMIKFLFLVLGSFGIITMWGAVFADVGVTLLAIANSLRTIINKKIFYDKLILWTEKL